MREEKVGVEKGIWGLGEDTTAYVRSGCNF